MFIFISHASQEGFILLLISLVNVLLSVRLLLKERRSLPIFDVLQGEKRGNKCRDEVITPEV